MGDLWHGFAGKLDELAGKWPGYGALGTFLLYLFGYLALRFQLYAYGVSTNLDAFDEKYFFAGCRFLLFLGMTVPSILLILAVVILPLYVLARAVPASLRSRCASRISTWLKRPYLLRVVGCALPLVLIQVVFRQCVLLSNMLLRGHPPDYWITSVLLGGEFAQALYFAGLVLGAGLSVAVFACALNIPAQAGLATALTGLMMFLVALELLLLPVNYGILVGSTSLPRVSQVENQAKLAAGGSAWLVWETKESLTYLVCENNTRSMVSIPKKENRVSVVGYDPIFEAAYRPPCAAVQ
ncbi:MAG TPA: hypothetical protein VKB79_16285 [Bryobacteraceae bacterium]|nr:hypothetical protein [Bryobacteraceae bacterium]